MKKAKKKEGKMVQAYCLGGGSLMEQKMLEERKIRVRSDGGYEVFSQEVCVASFSEIRKILLEKPLSKDVLNSLFELVMFPTKMQGEMAYAGDYFKVDSSGFPYPNKKDWFEAHHKHIDGDEYMQIPNPVDIWEADLPVCDEIQYLLSSGRLRINEADSANYFNAFLWGADLSAARDAVVVFYSVDRNADGKITDVDFNFVARDEFEKTYTVLE